MRTTLLASALALAAPAASAAVFAVDGGFGPTSATRSTATGFDWLDLDYSVANFDDLAARLAPGGDLDDWRLATTEEVSAFWADAGVAVTGVGGPAVETADPAQVAATDALIDLVFTTPLGGGGSIDVAFGFTAEPGSTDASQTVAWLQRRFGDDTYVASAATVGDDGPKTVSFGDQFIGGWLVRPYDVPAPGAAVLLGLALAPLALRRR